MKGGGEVGDVITEKPGRTSTVTLHSCLRPDNQEARSSPCRGAV